MWKACFVASPGFKTKQKKLAYAADNLPLKLAKSEFKTELNRDSSTGEVGRNSYAFCHCKCSTAVSGCSQWCKPDVLQGMASQATFFHHKEEWPNLISCLDPSQNGRILWRHSSYFDVVTAVAIRKREGRLRHIRFIYKFRLKHPYPLKPELSPPFVW